MLNLKGNFGLININAVGGGGELDPHGATGNGNPIGGLVFSNIAGFVSLSCESELIAGSRLLFINQQCQGNREMQMFKSGPTS
jgi:hypothetical protein